MQLKLRSALLAIVALTELTASPSAQSAAPKVTSPQQFFGHEIGSVFVLPYYT